MEEKDFTLLDDYFNGLLDEAGRRQVLQRAGTDPEFAQELALRRQMNDWLQAEPARKALRENLSALGAEYFPAKSTPLRVVMRRLLTAAAAVLALAAAVWFFLRPSKNLYEQYAQHTPLQLTVRGAPAQPAAEAEAAFRRADYAEALAKLETLSTPDDALVQLYRAICLIELGRTAEARTLLQPLADGTGALRTEGQWYIALSYLKDNDLPNCQTALKRLQAGEDHYESAQELLLKIQ